MSGDDLHVCPSVSSLSPATMPRNLRLFRAGRPRALAARNFAPPGYRLGRLIAPLTSARRPTPRSICIQAARGLSAGQTLLSARAGLVTRARSLDIFLLYLASRPLDRRPRRLCRGPRRVAPPPWLLSPRARGSSAFRGGTLPARELIPFFAAAPRTDKARIDCLAPFSRPPPRT